MAMRCLGRARLTGAGARPLALSFFRAVVLAVVLAGFLPAALRAGDFFCAPVRLAALDFGFCLAIDVLPFWYRGKTLAQIAPFVGWANRSEPTTLQQWPAPVGSPCPPSEDLLGVN